MSNIYEGITQMKPEIENRHFFSGDDDFTYQVPQVYFECFGETDHSQVAFDWSKSEKRRYKVILEDYDELYLKGVIDRDIKCGGDYTLRDTK